MRSRILVVLGMSLFGFSSAYAAQVVDNHTSISQQSGSQSRNWSVSPEVGLARLSYEQTDMTPATQTNVLMKVDGRYAIRDTDWDLGATVFGTVFSLASNFPAGVRVWGWDLRTGYTFEPLARNLTLRLDGGLAYRGLSVDRKEFGYTPLIAYEIYPTVSYALPNDQTVSGYFKYLPLMTDLFNPFPAGSPHEITLGATYRFIGFTDKPDSSVRLEWAHQSINFGDATRASLSLLTVAYIQSF